MIEVDFAVDTLEFDAEKACWRVSSGSSLNYPESTCRFK